MTATVTICDRAFHPLDTLGSVQLSERNWLINGVGQFSFRLGLSDSHYTKKNLRIGNIVQVKSDLCPIWVGRIDRISWEDADSVNVMCNGREAFLRGLAYDSKVATTADMQELLYYFISDPHIRLQGIVPGRIYDDAIDLNENLPETGDFLELVKQLAEQLDAEFRVDHQSGRFDFQKRLGSDKTGSVLIDTEDVIESPRFTIDTQALVWSSRVIGPTGNEDNPEEMQDATVADQLIRNFVQGEPKLAITHIYDVLSGAGLEEKARAVIEQSLKTVFVMDVSINASRGLLKKCWLGDAVRLRLNDIAWGLTERMRIKGVGITSEDSPECRLVLEPERPRQWLDVFGGK